MRDQEKQPCVYILASRRNGTLYIGVTSSIADRMFTHQHALLPGFTSKYDVKRLVYYELHETMELAILREKRLKKWNRLWKIRLIEQMNPDGLSSIIRRQGFLLLAQADKSNRRRGLAIDNPELDPRLREDDEISQSQLLSKRHSREGGNLSGYLFETI